MPLIPGGVFVNGKTVDEVAEIVKKKYDEYIIDAQVTVSLEKATSYRYSVIGDVAQPGIRLMNHRMTVTEAIGGSRWRVVDGRQEQGGCFASWPRCRAAADRGERFGDL